MRRISKKNFALNALQVSFFAKKSVELWQLFEGRSNIVLNCAAASLKIHFAETKTDRYALVTSLQRENLPLNALKVSIFAKNLLNFGSCVKGAPTLF